MFPRKNRPVVSDLPYSRLDVAVNCTSAAVLLLMAAGLFATWGSLPERVPMHFGWSGAPNGWGSPASLGFVFFVAIPVNVLLFGIQRIPESYNIPFEVTEQNARDMYTVMRRMVIVLQLMLNLVFATSLLFCVLVATGGLSGLPFWFVPVVVAAPLGVTAWGVLAARRVHHAHRHVMRP
jgi:uncharacterized membrane protein